jgi:drug/metabolite transporter (DMT)-like permease
MLGGDLWNLFVVVAGGVIVAILIYYFILSRRFPNEDPRLVSGRFTLRQQLIPLILAIVASGAFFILAKSLGFIDVVKYGVNILVVLSLAVNFYLNKRYGRLGANQEPPKIGKARVTPLLIGLLITVMFFIFISGFFHLPSIYPTLALLLFLAVFISSIFWVRHSRRKNNF